MTHNNNKQEVQTWKQIKQWKRQNKHNARFETAQRAYAAQSTAMTITATGGSERQAITADGGQSMQVASYEASVIVLAFMAFMFFRFWMGF